MQMKQRINFISKDEYLKNLNDMKLELRNGNGNPLHQFHYGRLMAEGIEEDRVVKMLYTTASILELAFDQGAIKSASQIEASYSALPSNDPTGMIENDMKFK